MLQCLVIINFSTVPELSQTPNLCVSHTIFSVTRSMGHQWSRPDWCFFSLDYLRTVSMVRETSGKPHLMSKAETDSSVKQPRIIAVTDGVIREYEERLPVRGNHFKCFLQEPDRRVCTCSCLHSVSPASLARIQPIWSSDHPSACVFCPVWLHIRKSERQLCWVHQSYFNNMDKATQVRPSHNTAELFFLVRLLNLNLTVSLIQSPTPLY